MTVADSKSATLSDFNAKLLQGSQRPASGKRLKQEIEVAEQKFPEPEIGRQVRYVLHKESANAGQVRTATIVKVNPDGVVNLNVPIAEPSDIGQKFQEQYVTNTFIQGAKYDPEKGEGTWHWPDHAAITPKVAPKSGSQNAA